MDQTFQAIDRILKGQPAALMAYWERDGAAWDPGTTTVTVTNDEGVVLALNQPATSVGTGLRTYELPASATGTLDFLTVAWTASDGSVLTTYAEVVGGFYFSVAQARLRTP